MRYKFQMFLIENFEVGNNGNIDFKESTFLMKRKLVSNDFLKFFNEDLFCDVSLKTEDGKRISAHRILLYEISDYFKAKLLTGLSDDNHTQINILGVRGYILQQLIKTCYSSEITINTENVLELTKASYILQFLEVYDNCIKFYIQNLKPSNCLSILQTADQHNLKRLVQTATQFAIDRFGEIAKCREFLLLNIAQLSDLLAADDLFVPFEEDVFLAVMDWIKYDINDRKQYLENLLKCIQFAHVKNSFLWFKAYQQSIDINAPELLSSIAAKRFTEDQNTTPRSSKFHIIYQDSVKLKIDRYFPNQNVWRKIKEIDLKFKTFSVVYYEGRLIIVGDIDGQDNFVNVAKSIDMRTYEVTDLPPLNSVGSNLSSILFNGCVYVFTVSLLSCNTTSVERFDLSKNEWSICAQMNANRYNAAYVVLANRIYAIGGRDAADTFLNSVEYYEAVTDSWQMVSPLRQGRASAAACASNGFIYVLGGENLESVLKTVERYNPRTDSWITLLFVLPGGRCWYGPCANDGDWVYLAGGLDCIQDLNTFEKINIATGEVIGMQKLRHPYHAGKLIKT